MDSKKKAQIAKKFEEGSYYLDAMDWYAQRYLFPVTERSYLAIMCLIIVVLLAISILNIRNFSTNTEEPAIIIRTDLEPLQFSLLKRLAKRSESTQAAVAKYLLKDYVLKRERYIAKEMSSSSKRLHLTKMIKSSSSKGVLNEYRNFMNKNNPYSHLARYKDKTNRLIDINKVSFLEEDKTLGKAKVIFTATEVAVSGVNKEKDKSRWAATVHFRLSDIETIAQTGAPLRFLVKYYRVDPVK